MPHSHITFGVDLLPKDQTNVQGATPFTLGKSDQNQRWNVYLKELNDIDMTSVEANKVFAGPASGNDAAPSFRALTADDIPDLSSVYTDTKVTQSYKAYSGYTYWRPLVIGYSSGSTEGFTPTDQTDLVYTFSNLSVQPSTGTIKATVFKGSGASLTSLNGSNVSSGTVAAARGGTGMGSYVIGDILYASASTTLSTLGGNNTTTTKFLKSVASTAGTADAPEWSTIASTDISDFSTAVNIAKVQIVRLNVSGGDS